MGGSIYLFLTDSFEIDLYVQGLLQAQGQWLHPGICPGARHRNCPDPSVPCGVCIFQFNHVLYGKGVSAVIWIHFLAGSIAHLVLIFIALTLDWFLLLCELFLHFLCGLRGALSSRVCAVPFHRMHLPQSYHRQFLWRPGDRDAHHNLWWAQASLCTSLTIFFKYCEPVNVVFQGLLLCAIASPLGWSGRWVGDSGFLIETLWMPRCPSAHSDAHPFCPPLTLTPPPLGIHPQYYSKYRYDRISFIILSLCTIHIPI